MVVARIRAAWKRLDQALFLEASAVGLTVVGFWLVYWMAFYPGIVGWDPIDQLRQLHLGRMFDWHPIPHTLILGAFVGVFGSVSALAFAQLATAGVLYTAMYYRLVPLGASRTVLRLAAAWLALSPVYGTGLISVWKDTVFAIGTLGMSLALLGLVLARGRARSNWIGLFAASLVVALVRHNGPYLILCVFVAWFALLAPHRRLLALCALALAICVPALQMASRTLAVKPRHRSLTQQVLMHHVAAFVSDPAAEIPEAVAAEIYDIMPRDEWRERYDCASARDIMFDAGLTGRRLPNVSATLSIWLELARRNPGTLFRHSRCATRHLWAPGEAIVLGPLLEGESVVQQAVDRKLHLHTESLWPSANRMLTRFVRDSYASRLSRAIAWSPALPLYASALLTAVACRRQRSTWPLAVVLPGLLNTALWFGLASFPHIRFQFPLFLMLPLAIALSTLPRIRREPGFGTDPAID